MKYLLPTVALAALLTGCGTDSASQDVEYAKSLQSKTEHTVISPAFREFPVMPAVANARPVPVSSEPAPIWNPTKVMKVNVVGYIDERGMAWEPSEVYVVVENGGWNKEAVNSGRLYVPTPNSVTPVNLPGVSYGSGSVVPKENLGPRSAVSLVDPRQMRITGKMDPKDGVYARSQANENEVAIYDNQMGWVIVPQAYLSGMADVVQPGIKPRADPTVANVSEGRVDGGVVKKRNPVVGAIEDLVAPTQKSVPADKTKVEEANFIDL